MIYEFLGREKKSLRTLNLPLGQISSSLGVDTLLLNFS